MTPGPHRDTTEDPRGESFAVSGAAVILAAGGSERFAGGSKQLALFHGRPLIRHVVDTALSAELAAVVVVLGHDAGAIAAVLPDDRRLWVVVNTAVSSAQADSLGAGLSALPSEIRFAVVVLGDQPLIERDAIEAVAGSVRAGAQVARAVYTDGPSHPVAFHRDVWAKLMELEGDEGARQLFEVLDIREVSVRGRRPCDVDTREDLARLQLGVGTQSPG